MQIYKSIIILFFLLNIKLLFAQSVYWEKIGNFSYIYDLKINSFGNIFICDQGDSGVRRTTNDGDTWELRYIQYAHIYKIAINDSNNIFLADQYKLNNSIFKSTDNGNSWVQCSLTGGRMRSIHISREGYVYAGNDEGVFFKSTNNGTSWSSVTVTNKEINCIGTSSNGQIFLGTAGNGVFSSTDFGSSWYQINNVNGHINSIVVNDSDYVFITNFNLVLVSKDYGNSWTQAGTFSYTNGVLCIDSIGTIYAGYEDVYKSTNNGLNWNNLGGPGNITAIDTYGENIYLATYSGVYRYDPDVSPPTFEGSNYFPLSVGNKWQYIRTTYDSDGPSYLLTMESVEYDTLIANDVYHKMTDFSDLIKYSVDDKILYLYWNDSDRLHINFNVPPDSQYIIFTKEHNYITVTAIGGENSIFNNNRIYGGYLHIGGVSGYQVEYTDSIGITYDREADTFLDRRRNLIQAIIHDSTDNPRPYTYHYKPTFEITPITVINSAWFNLEFKVNHNYTRILPNNAPPWHSGVDFIDNVKMQSHYSKNDSTVYNTIIFPSHGSNPVNSDYLISIELDTMLMKDGFVFNYRFEATDKGIIPEQSSSPDSGYYQCIWDESTNIEDSRNNIPTEFSLEQNYPNPFNPTTTIYYEIPERGIVTIKIYDVLGNKVTTLVNDEKSAGSYEVEFDGSTLTSGIYFYRLVTGANSQTRKMIMIK
jgi:Secretion system C-terminal sorting domain